MRKILQQLPLLLGLATSFSVGAVQVQADCGVLPSDSTFVPDGTSSPRYSVQVAPTSIINGPLPSLAHTATITINRVVGPGTASEFNADGTLKAANWDLYVKNGVLSPYAFLQLSPETVVETTVPTTIGIYVNGYYLQNVPNASLFSPGAGQFVCVQISTQYLKFAQFVPGQAPTPAVNTFGFTADLYLQNFFDSVLSSGVGLGTLTFKALAPIILVHGINADGSWFTANSFTTPFDDAKVPYSIANFAPANIADSGAALVLLIPSLAQQFGVSKIHIVAHSKGGIWSRYFLANGPISTNLYALPTPTNFGVLSLTTLDTPNNGSILADAVTGLIDVSTLLAAEAGPEASIALYAALELGSPYLDQITDLTRSAVEGENRELGDTPNSFQDVDGTVYNIFYRAVAADADIGDKTNASGSRYVDSTDCAGMSIAGIQLNVNICQVLYWLMGNEDNFYGTASVPALGCGSSSPGFDCNDLVVTQSSASVLNYGGSPLSFPIVVLNPIRKNHSTVGDSCVSGGVAHNGVSCTSGSGVLGVIQQLQPVQ